MSDSTKWKSDSEALVVEKSVVYRRLDDLRAQLGTERERLHFLLESGKAISRIFALDELLEFSAGLILDFADADACGIYLKGKDGKLHPARTANRRGGAKALKVSGTIIQHVVANRVAIITRSAMEDDRFSHGESIVIGGIQSVMCAPLTAVERMLGVLYVVSDRPTRQFDEGSLDVLSAFASQLAVAIENTRVIELEATLRTREKEAALGRVAGEISHALKNRLNSMIGPAEMIEMVVDEKEEVLRCAEDIKKGVAAMRDYVVNNLDALRGGGGGKEKESAAAPVGEVVDGCIAVCRERFAREGVAVTKRFSDNLPRVAIGREKLEMVLDNLFNNSADAMRNSAEKRIMLGVFWEPGEREVAIQFTDTGCGIPEKNLGRVFDDYFTTKAEGTGIGLAQSRALLARAGGTIEARSKDGKGATFLITLPVEKDRVSGIGSRVSGKEKEG